MASSPDGREARRGGSPRGDGAPGPALDGSRENSSLPDVERRSTGEAGPQQSRHGALTLNQWIEAHRPRWPPTEAAARRSYLERSVLILRALVERIMEGGDCNKVDTSHAPNAREEGEAGCVDPRCIVAENIVVQDSASSGGGGIAVDFAKCGDFAFFRDDRAEEGDRRTRSAMHALGRVAYEMFMPAEGPTVDQFRNASAKTDKSDKDEAMSEEEVIALLRKMPRMSASEEDGSGVVDALRGSHVPFPLCRFVSDLLLRDGGGDAVRVRSERAFSSFADVLSDLEQMASDPDAFLHQSSAHRWKLAFGEKLYGRDADLKSFLDAAGRVSPVHDDPLVEALRFALRDGRKEVVLVSGPSGAGKSRLAKAAGASLEGKGWRFLHCKFDRVAHPEPLSILAHAFDDFFRSIVEGCPKHDNELFDLSSDCNCTGLSKMRQRLEQIVGIGSVGKLAKHIPSLLVVMDMRMPTSAVDVTETEMQMLFAKLLQALSSRRHPILFFIDDLQWSDPLSLAMLCALVKGARPDLLHLISSDSDSDSSPISLEEDSNVLFAGSYRDTDVDGNHPLAKVLDKFRSDGSLTEISLSGLTVDALNEMLSATLHLPVRRVRSLSELVKQKTGGHPLHVIAFIRKLAADSLLTHSFYRGWQWDLDSIAILPITASVAELFAFKLRQLPNDILSGIQILSLFGSQIDQHVFGFLAGCDGDSSVDMSAAIHVAMREGLLEQAGHLFCFAHDQIQNAAIDSISEDAMVPLLRKLAKALINNASAAGEMDSVVFAVVDFVNRIDTPSSQERATFAEMNLRAASNSISVPDFAAAARYAERGISFLSGSYWDETRYDLSLGLYEAAVRSHFSSMGGDRDLLMQRITAVFTNGRTFEDKFPTVCIWIELLSTTDLSRAIQESVKALKKLGEPLDMTTVGYLEVCGELRRCKQQYLVAKAKEFSPEKRLGKESAKARAMKILATLFTYYHRQHSFLAAWVSCRMVTITMNYGHCESAAFGAAAFAASLVTILDDIDEGYAWGKIAVSLLKLHDGSNDFAPNVNNAVYGVVFHWKEPLQSTLQPLAQGIKSSLTTGNVEFAVINTGYYTVRSFNCGKNINTLLGECAALANQFSSDSPMYVPLLQFLLTPLYNILRDLEGNRDCTEVQRASFPLEKVKLLELDEIAQLALEIKQLSCFHNILTYQTTKAFLFRDMVNALRYTDMYVKLFLSNVQRFKYSEIYSIYYEALITLYFMRQTGNEKFRARGERALTQMRDWTRHSEWNFSSKMLLMEAEWHNTMKNYDKAASCYEGSIKAARDHHFVHEQAIASELAAMFFLDRGQDAKARELYTRSIESYRKWGAHAIVRRVEKSMKDMLDADSMDMCPVGTSLATTTVLPEEDVQLRPVETNLSLPAVPREEPPASRKRQLHQPSGGTADSPTADTTSDTGSVILLPGQNGATENNRFLEGKFFLLAGAFVEVGLDRTAANVAVTGMLESFGATIATRMSKRMSKNTTFLLAGKYTDANKINAARKRKPPVEIINLYRLQKLLLGELTFEACSALPELSTGSFKGNTYQPAQKLPNATGEKY